MSKEELEPKINIDFVYRFCDDIKAMRSFYTDLIGLTETIYTNEEEYAFIGYKGGGFTLYIVRGDTVKPEKIGWTKQPGYDGGTIETTSYTINVPEDEFRAVLKRLRDADVEAFSDKPRWSYDEYWSYIVKDPMGVTIEVYMKPGQKSESNEWVD
ncbi:MAG: VOC family protein [Candidatus Thorarchaeota archaeon]